MIQNLNNFILDTKEQVNLVVTYEVLQPNKINELNDYGFPMPSHQEAFIAIVKVEINNIEHSLTKGDKACILAEIETLEWKNVNL